MLSTQSRISRALLASPLLFLAWVCFTEMDQDKMIAHHQKVLSSGARLDWDGGSLAIFPRFYSVRAIDDMWRGVTIAFGLGSLGIDPISWWQSLSFLTDLGPLYAVLIMESTRPTSRWRPAYL